MAALKQNEKDEHSPVEAEFRNILQEIGGRERIHLVSDVTAEEGSHSAVLEEFMEDVFNLVYSNPIRVDGGSVASPNKNGNAELDFVEACQEHQPETDIQIPLETDTHSDCRYGEAQSESLKDLEINTKPSGEGKKAQEQLKENNRREIPDMQITKRTIDSRMIIFIFSLEFVNGKGNTIRLKEILKDVRDRTKLAALRPALLGLVCAKEECGEIHKCVALLDQLLRSVFRKHPPESIWTGQFVPRKADRTLAIKKHVCRTLQSCLSSECSVARGYRLSGLLCFPRTPKKRQRNGTSRTPDKRNQGQLECVEEGIPLK